MNIVKFIPFFVLCFFANALKSQDAVSKRKLGLVVKTDILAPSLDWLISGSPSYSLSVEKFIGKRQSFQLSGYYSYNHSTEPSQIIYSSYQIVPEYRFYPNDKQMHNGVYCGAYSRLINEHSYEIYSRSTDEFLYRSLELGVISGYQIYPFKHLVFDFLFGLGGRKVIYNKRIDSSPQSVHPESNYKQTQYLFGRLSINIGYIIN